LFFQRVFILTKVCFE